MRVIAGKVKGLKLKAPEGLDTRPTTDKTREAIFGSLQFEIPGSRVLDLFAGSGAMGIEALSRGADEAVFIDKSRNAVRCIEDNLKAAHMSAKVINPDFSSALQRLEGEFDFIFVDPPYQSGFYREAIELIKIRGLLSEKGKLVLEHDGSLEVEGVRIIKDKKYGKAHIKICGLELEN